MDISIIIVNYNTKGLLRNCLESIFEKTKDILFEVIVSDNGSIDGSVDMIKSEFPQVILIENKENLGFGTANNRGVEVSSGEYILFLNSDTILKNNAVLLFFIYAKENNKSLLGGYLIDENNNIIHSYENYSKLIKSLIRLLYYSFPVLPRLKLLFLSEKKKVEFVTSCLMVDYITGADLFIKKTVFLEIGGFDENFFMYFEDDDLCRRAKKCGYVSFIISGPQIVHFEGKSLTIKTQKLKILEKSFFYYIKKHNSKIKYVFIKPLLFIYVFLGFFSPYHTFQDKYESFLMVIYA